MKKMRKNGILKKWFQIILLLLLTFPKGHVFASEADQPAFSGWAELKSRYAADESTDRLILVKYLGGSRVKVIMYEKAAGEGTLKWRKLLSCRGFCGKNGLNKEQEGDVKTPTGVFYITEGFGIRENPGLKDLRYTVIDESCYWSGEYDTYNTLVRSDHPIAGAHLIECSPQYNYALNIGYNPQNIYKKGSGIFLHCTGPRSYTMGCIAVSEENMIRIMQNTTDKTLVCIYPK